MTKINLEEVFNCKNVLANYINQSFLGLDETYPKCSDLTSTYLFYAEREPLLLRCRTLAALPILAADFAVPNVWIGKNESGSGADDEERYLTIDWK